MFTRNKQSSLPVVPTAAPGKEETPTQNGLRRRNSSSGTGTGNTIKRLATANAMGAVGNLLSVFGTGGAGIKPKKHKITKRYKNRLLKRRKTKRTYK